MKKREKWIVYICRSSPIHIRNYSRNNASISFWIWPLYTAIAGGIRPV